MARSSTWRGAVPGLTLDQALVEFLRHKELLLVLDNCEHVLDEAAELMEMLERSCPRVRVPATSREGVGIDGERIVRCRPWARRPGKASVARSPRRGCGAPVRGAGPRVWC